ncbi:uncharacterized protein LACBIDRAFT_303218 [Laccaria bicolor S238N-H82]|uniref:Predicted protein n=1 Tax=Laccaria bicolor (strain S238N-H82 / ATCC MYA-4686) TaxID=486041 RepID=B0DJ54_LACBS|nr:uncharacterized protein LACBIDRAFT_303218 [Laccaria bicolor S238N-H82]EDR05345.1 predicted protein [Laccaria bicolor S238N-H82]|eukprot:XP_001883903.1 predicted protein [Laccaria bicolor S238N-H82]
MAIPSDHYPYSFVQQSEPEPLSLFAQTLRETDEEFYTTFPQARAARQAQIDAQLNHGHGPAENYGFGEGICYEAPPSLQPSPHHDSMQVECRSLYYDYASIQSMAIHPTTPSQNLDSKQFNQAEQLYQFYAPPLESRPDLNTYPQVNQVPSPTQSQHCSYPCCKSKSHVVDHIVSDAPAPGKFRQTISTRTEVPPPFDPTPQYRTVAEPAWPNSPASTTPTRRHRMVQEPTVRVTSRDHPPHVYARRQSDYQTHAPSSRHTFVWRAHRSVSPRPLMPLTPLPIKCPAEKKPPLACLFCRRRKIACGAPIPGSKDKTCNQCQRRSLRCEYPLESRRGMRKKKVNINADGPKVTLTRSKS